MNSLLEHLAGFILLQLLSSVYTMCIYASPNMEISFLEKTMKHQNIVMHLGLLCF